MTNVTRVTLYKSGGEWCYAAWTGSGPSWEHDHNDTLDSSSEDESTAKLEQMFPAAQIVRVKDVK